MSFKRSQHLSATLYRATRGLWEKSTSISRKEMPPLRGGKLRLATYQHRQDRIVLHGRDIEACIASAYWIILNRLY